MNLAAHTRPVLLVLLVVSVWRPAHGETIYKSVDSEGRVTYSSTPPPSGSRVEKLMLPSSPSEQDIRQARELAQRVETQGRQLESKRLEQEAAKKAEDAIAQGYKHKEMSEEEFESLPEKDGKTIYLIYEEE